MRNATEVNVNALRHCIDQAEGETGCSNLTMLYSDVASAYNRLDSGPELFGDIPADISPSIVKTTIDNRKMTIKTTPGKKGSRSKQELLYDVLVDAIQTAEGENGDKFEKRTKSLFEAIAREYNRHDDNDVQTTSGVVKRTITERGMELQTPVGKRGRKSKNETVFFPSDEVMELIGTLIEMGVDFEVKPGDETVGVSVPVEIAEQLAS